MNTKLLNVVSLDGGVIIKKGSGGGGGNTPGGGGDTPSPHGSDVNFRDCDGTLLYSYSKDQFLALTELPSLPIREGLICQGWNWDLEDAQSYVRDYGKQEIGATYITDDGKTRLYINITSEYSTDVSLCFNQTVSNGVIIDWGDGSSTQTLSSSGKVSTTHVYSNIGTYIISLEVIEGCKLYLGHESSSGTILGQYNSSNWTNLDKLTAVEIGKNVPYIPQYAFYACRKLSFITIPELLYIGKYAFYNSDVYYVPIPKYATTIEGNAFTSCKSLVYVSIPKSVNTIAFGAFSSCTSLYSVFLPEKVTAIEEQTFSQCTSLTSITISKKLTHIGTCAFEYCKSLLSISIPATTNFYGYSGIFQYSGLCDMPPINNFYITDLFLGCENLTEVNIPEGTTTIGTRAFSTCTGIGSVFIPEGVTTIKSYAFTKCYRLIHVEFPSTIATIESQAFSDNYAKRVFDFRKSTLVPTMAYSPDFNVDKLKIVVPDALYDEWIAATNWASVASKIVKASEFNG